MGSNPTLSETKKGYALHFCRAYPFLLYTMTDKTLFRDKKNSYSNVSFSFRGRTTGVEPANDGVTIHCLTTWLRPPLLVSIIHTYTRQKSIRKNLFALFLTFLLHLLLIKWLSSSVVEQKIHILSVAGSTPA